MENQIDLVALRDDMNTLEDALNEKNAQLESLQKDFLLDNPKAKKLYAKIEKALEARQAKVKAFEERYKKSEDSLLSMRSAIIAMQKQFIDSDPEAKRCVEQRDDILHNFRYRVKSFSSNLEKLIQSTKKEG